MKNVYLFLLYVCLAVACRVAFANNPQYDYLLYYFASLLVPLVIFYLSLIFSSKRDSIKHVIAISIGLILYFVITSDSFDENFFYGVAGAASAIIVYAATTLLFKRKHRVSSRE